MVDVAAASGARAVHGAAAAGSERERNVAGRVDRALAAAGQGERPVDVRRPPRTGPPSRRCQPGCGRSSVHGEERRSVDPAAGVGRRRGGGGSGCRAGCRGGRRRDGGRRTRSWSEAQPARRRRRAITFHFRMKRAPDHAYRGEIPRIRLEAIAVPPRMRPATRWKLLCPSALQRRARTAGVHGLVDTHFLFLHRADADRPCVGNSSCSAFATCKPRPRNRRCASPGGWRRRRKRSCCPMPRDVGRSATYSTLRYVEGA